LSWLTCGCDKLGGRALIKNSQLPLGERRAHPNVECWSDELFTSIRTDTRNRLHTPGTPPPQPPWPHPAASAGTVVIGTIVFGVILAGTFVGWVIKERLPKHHLSDETKSTATESMAVVATFSALVLGLLISNANTSFSALGGEVTTLSAQILRLDQLLRRYGPETGSARGDLATTRRTHDRQSVSRQSSRCRPCRSQDNTYVKTYKRTRQMVAGSSYDACWEDRRHALAIDPARRSGNSKSFRRSSGLLVDFTVRQFWSVCPPQFTSAVTLTLCAVL
jgi:hypothetical protein